MHEDTKERYDELVELIDGSDHFDLTAGGFEEYLFDGRPPVDKDDPGRIEAEFQLTVAATISENEEDDENEYRVK